MFLITLPALQSEDDASIGDILEIAGSQLLVKGDAVIAVVGVAAVREAERVAMARVVSCGGAVVSCVLRCLHTEEASDSLVVGVRVQVKDVIGLGRLRDAQVVRAETGTGHGGRRAESQRRGRRQSGDSGGATEAPAWGNWCARILSSGHCDPWRSFYAGCPPWQYRGVCVPLKGHSRTIGHKCADPALAQQG